MFLRDRRVFEGEDGSGGGAPGAGAEGAAGGAEGAPAGAWDASLAEETRAGLAQKGFKSTNDLGAAYLKLESTIGTGRVALPSEDAGDDAWNDFYNATGRPENAKGYAFKAGEDVKNFDEGLDGWYRDTAHKWGLSERQAAGVFTDWNERQAGVVSGVESDMKQSLEKSTAELRKDWGADYDQHKRQADLAFSFLFEGNEETARTTQLADGTFLFDNPMVARALHKAAKAMELSEQEGLPGGTKIAGRIGALTAAEAQAEINSIQGAASDDPEHPYRNNKHREHIAMTERMSQLYAIAHPGIQGEGA